MKISWRDVSLEEVIKLCESQPKGDSKTVLKLTVSYYHRRCKEQRVKAMLVNEKIVCIAMYGFVFKKGYVNLLANVVLEEHRYKKYGQAMLTIIHTEATDAGLTHFKVEALNLRAKAWYVKNGFKFLDDKSRKCFMDITELNPKWPLEQK